MRIWALVIILNWQGSAVVDMESREACVRALAKIDVARWATSYCVDRQNGEVLGRNEK